MKSLIKHIVMLSLSIITIMCFILSINYTFNLKKEKHTINIYFDDENMSLSNIKSIREEEKKKENPVIFTAWKQESKQSIENEEFNRRIEVTSILVNGDSSLIANGTILFEDDKEGCLIDEDIAYKLFGDTNIIGKKIKYEDRELIVRGIHKGTSSTIFMQTLDNYEGNINGITLYKGKDTNIKSFMTSYGLFDNIVDNKIYYNFSKFCVLVLPAIILVFIEFKLFKKALQAKNKYILKSLYIILILILLIIFIKVINIKIPLEMLPNEWSDFKFWGELYKTYVKKIKYFLYMKKYNIDIFMIEYTGKVMFFSLISLISFLINKSLFKVHITKKK